LTPVVTHPHAPAQGYGPRPDRALVAPAPFVMVPFALAFVGLAAAKALGKAR